MEASTSRKTQGVENIELNYGSGDVRGTVETDVVGIAGVKANDYKLITITDVNEGRLQPFTNGKFDGVCGLAFSGVAKNGMQPVLDKMIDEQSLTSKMFSFYMSNAPGSTTSALYLGGVDPSKAADNNWQFHAVTKEEYWQVKLTKVVVGGQDIITCPAEGCKVAIDSGTSLLTGPSDSVKLITAPVIEKVHDDCSNYKELPQMSFFIDNTEYAIKGDDYIMFFKDGTQDVCIVAVTPLDVAAPKGPLWILGDVFMRKYYTVFDRSTQPARIGFTRAANAGYKVNLNHLNLAQFNTNTNSTAMAAVSMHATDKSATAPNTLTP